MLSNMWKLCAIFLYFTISKAICSYQPTYQVKVLIQTSQAAVHKHHCNGVIVQARLILTTTNCLQRNNNALYTAADILIAAGSDNQEQHVFIASATNIFLQTNYSMAQVNHSLALINLSQPLPIDARKDIQWIILDDLGLKNGTGFAFFTYSNCFNKWNGRLEMTQIPLFTGMACNSTHNSTICSLYQLPNELACDQLNEFFIDFGDLGTGLIKNNRLVGVLSYINPISPALRKQKLIFDCSRLMLKAEYIAIAFHADWIYEIIANQEYIDIMYGHHQFSTPYQMNENQRPMITGKCYATAVTTRKPIHAQDNSEEVEFSSHLEINAACKTNINYYQLLTLVFLVKTFI